MEIGKINLTGKLKISSAEIPVSVIKKIEREELKETAYDTEDIINDKVEAGTVTVLKEGQNRVEKTVYNLLDKEIISEETTVLQEGENRILEIGTKPIIIETGTVDLDNVDTGYEWLDEVLEAPKVWQEYYESVAQGNPITKPIMVTGENDLVLYPITTPFPADTTYRLFFNFKIRNIMGFSVEPDTPFSMEEMFRGASDIKYIPFFDTSNATNMNNAFYGCTNLTTIPLLDTSNIINNHNMFFNCRKLSDESLNNILAMFAKSGITFELFKNLKRAGFNADNYPAERIEALENYQDFINAGWTIGY